MEEEIVKEIEELERQLIELREKLYLERTRTPEPKFYAWDSPFAVEDDGVG